MIFHAKIDNIIKRPVRRKKETLTTRVVVGVGAKIMCCGTGAALGIMIYGFRYLIQFQPYDGFH